MFLGFIPLWPNIITLIPLAAIPGTPELLFKKRNSWSSVSATNTENIKEELGVLFPSFNS
jgi:hypothetical protein